MPESAQEKPGVCYAAPPRPCNAAGKVRAVGIELELANLSVEETLAIVASTMNGTVTSESPSRGTVDVDGLGRFKVELDAEVIQNRKHLVPLEKLGFQHTAAASEALDAAVVRVARELVPIEIVTPPVPWNLLHRLDSLWPALRAAGAEDTKTSLRFAFGLHLNPELADLEASTVVHLMRSYFLLEDWLESEAEVDVSRRLAPFIKPFPEEYRRRVIDPRYAPDWNAFVADYVADNPTRNRPLDVLPLIAEACSIDLEGRVENWSKVKARPAFHYRLPNSELSRRDWTPAPDWNRWVAVERLASRRLLLEELALAYTKASDLPTGARRAFTDLVERHLPALEADERPAAT